MPLDQVVEIGTRAARAEVAVSAALRRGRSARLARQNASAFTRQVRDAEAVSSGGGLG
jgi:hypothetical protein